MNNLISYLGLATLVAATVATDYCSTKICYSGYEHIACDNSGEFSSNCASDAAIVDFDSDLQNTILTGHNEIRNSVAGGSVENLTSACRMATMQWDDELAYLAELNVLQCTMKHDQCHNTEEFQYSGQNLAWYSFNGTPDYTNLTQTALDMWFEESKHTNMSIIDSYPSNYNGPTIGHFTVMVVDRNIRVGCAASTYSVSGKPYKEFLLACNYASASMKGFPIYKTCSKAGSECSSGMNSEYDNLCSTSEEYDVNDWH